MFENSTRPKRDKPKLSQVINAGSQADKEKDMGGQVDSMELQVGVGCLGFPHSRRESTSVVGGAHTPQAHWNRSIGTVPVHTTPTCTRAYAHFFSCELHCTCGSRLISVARFSKHRHLFVMFLLNVPFIRFPPVASSPLCSLSRPSASSTTQMERTRSNPCSSAHWSGMSGRLANPTPHTN